VAAAPVTARSHVRIRWPAPGSPWRISWSKAALLRAIRATVVVPGLFALTFKVIGDPQMTLFATFGGFATLIFANFGGSRKDKLTAHLGLAAVGSLALIIGTLVSGTTWLAAVVTVPVAFAIFFAGVIGPNAAGGVNGALLGYVLPVASVGGAATIGSRLEGWWLASAVGTAAVLLLSPKSPGDRLRASAVATAAALGRLLHASVRGEATQTDRDATTAAKQTLMETFTATPYRPTGLATADQAMANVVQALEWSASLADDMEGHADPSGAEPADQELLGVVAGLFDATAALLSGTDVQPDFARLEQARVASATNQGQLTGDPGAVRAAAAHAFHAQTLALAARGTAADALIASRRADPDTIAAERRSWYGEPETGPPRPESRRVALLDSTAVVLRHASLRSVWFLNATRGAVALAVAVAVADLTGVQHGFWVLLGTISVLRTSAASTGSIAWRALTGTVLGFAIGAALLLAIGTGPTALWIALPLAVFVASYAPGAAPFLVGQAAFTVTVVVLFNLLAPAGWRIGLLRVQDVGLGCAVSLVIGVLFWPRGAASVVGDDLSDAFRRGSAYLGQAVDWALGIRDREPDAGMAAITAGIRLDEALRGFLAEQGSKRLDKDDLWRLVMATMRLRLTAHSLAGLHVPAAGGSGAPGPVQQRLRDRAAELTSFYDQIAVQIGHVPRAQRPQVSVATPASFPPLAGIELGEPAAENGAGNGTRGRSDPGLTTAAPDVITAARGAAVAADEDVAVAEHLLAANAESLVAPESVALADALPPNGPSSGRPQLLWVREHLQHLSARVQGIGGPAVRLAELRRTPWWR
jgi:uncharacterized membrane protein YccC